jgi:hypothetical protein
MPGRKPKQLPQEPLVGSDNNAARRLGSRENCLILNCYLNWSDEMPLLFQYLPHFPNR